jgi:hypothetical protein
MKRASTGWPSKGRNTLRIRPSRGYVSVVGAKGQPIIKRAPFADWQERRWLSVAVACVSGYEAKHARIMADKGTHRNIECPAHVINEFPQLVYNDAPWLGRAAQHMDAIAAEVGLSPMTPAMVELHI